MNIYTVNQTKSIVNFEIIRTLLSECQQSVIKYLS